MDPESKAICEKWLEDIREEKWKESNQAHPSTMLVRDEAHPDTGWNKHRVDVLNGFHAYCLACSIHIYSRSDPSDKFSYFIAHFSDPWHRVMVGDVPHCRPILTEQEFFGCVKRFTCDVCSKVVVPSTHVEKAPLDNLIKKHIMAVQHKYNAFVMDDKKMSFLISMAMIPKLRHMILPKYKVNNFKAFCQLCEKDIWEEDSRHLRTQGHLQNVGKFLELTFNFNMVDVENEEKLRDLLAKVAWFHYSKENIPEPVSNNSQVLNKPKVEASHSGSFKKKLKEALKIVPEVIIAPPRVGLNKKNESSKTKKKTLMYTGDKEGGAEVKTEGMVTNSKGIIGEGSDHQKEAPGFKVKRSPIKAPLRGMVFERSANLVNLAAAQTSKSERPGGSKEMDAKSGGDSYHETKERRRSSSTSQTMSVLAHYATEGAQDVTLAPNEGVTKKGKEEKKMENIGQIEDCYVDPNLSNEIMDQEISKRTDQVYLDDDDLVVQILKETMAFCLLCKKKIRKWEVSCDEPDSCDDDQTPASFVSWDVAMKNHLDGLKHKYNLYLIRDPGYRKLKLLGKCPLLRSLTVTRFRDGSIKCNICKGQKIGTENHLDTVSHARSIIKFLAVKAGVDILNLEVINGEHEILELLPSHMLSNWRTGHANEPSGVTLLKREPKTDEDTSNVNPVDDELTGNLGEPDRGLNASHSSELSPTPPRENIAGDDIDGPLTDQVKTLRVKMDQIEGARAPSTVTKSPVKKSDKAKPASPKAAPNWRDRGESSTSGLGKINGGKNKKKEPVKVPTYHLGIRVVPQRTDIKTFHCDDCDVTGAIPDLPEHITNCLAPNGMTGVRTESCLDCHLYIISRRKTTHYDSEEHKKRLEEDMLFREMQREKKSQEQMMDLVEMKVLRVEGLPEAPDKLTMVYNVFSQFGHVESVKITGNCAVVNFLEQGAVMKAVSAVGLLINNNIVTLTEEILDVKDPENVALAEVIVRQLLEPSSLLHHCWDLAQDALDMMNSVKERERENQLLKALEIVLSFKSRVAWYVLPFGSRVTGLSLSSVASADIDVFAGSETVYFGDAMQNPTDQRHLVHRAQGLLSQDKNFQEMKTIARARVPIITFLHVPTQLQCDLSFRNGLSVRNSQLVRYMLTLDSRVRPMLLYLKEWNIRNGFKQILTSYAISMLVFVYLSRLPHPILPTIEQLRPPTVERCFIAGWNASFTEDMVWRTDNKASVVELLTDFFQYYAKFNYEDNVIFPVTGTSFRRELLFQAEKHSELPSEVQRCLKRIPLDGFTSNIDFCIMDPFDLSHNLTKRIRRRAFWALLRLMDKSSGLLRDGVEQL